MLSGNQGTLTKEVTVRGVGIHTGLECELTLRPAETDHGRVFVTAEGTRIPARVDFVVNCDRSTILGSGDCRVHTPEHLLSALAAWGIDNLEIGISGSEVPILDGSSLQFMQLLQEAGREDQQKPAKTYRLKEACGVGDPEGSLMMAWPAEETKYECVLHYPHPMLGTQVFTYEPGSTDFAKEIAPARTFALWEEVKPLLERGMALGGTLDNALVIYQDKFSTPLKVPDEPVRHKCLDLIGDLALLDCRLQAKVLAVKAGHRWHVELAKKVWEEMNS